MLGGAVSVIPETSGEDNLKSLAMVFAALDSAGSGKRVMIKDYL